MKRADVKIGTEYAVRRGNYGAAARVLIESDATRTYRVYGTGFGHGHNTTERCFKGKLVAGYYSGPDYGMGAGQVGFVRPRDIVHTWAEQEERDDAALTYRARMEAARRADESERAKLVERMKALGIDSGLDVEVDAFHYTGPSSDCSITREALVALVGLAESYAARADAADTSRT